ncbi:predicted protein [Uncinocarpus reesii 1704]|uniref:Uncharacterized protein n=1 Tax=Uncinocarpus reesii (strain UAMH 1704) TaxID=336963 RepID=C4JEQ5_UNCRE|nr:uncharacterized protein UREG_02215 [Uncinocarpus reesii 1704]EEP77366.1 predicted protein [Uncinocarpus reesii 1704]
MVDSQIPPKATHSTHHFEMEILEAPILDGARADTIRWSFLIRPSLLELQEPQLTNLAATPQHSFLQALKPEPRAHPRTQDITAALVSYTPWFRFCSIRRRRSRLRHRTMQRENMWFDLRPNVCGPWPSPQVPFKRDTKITKHPRLWPRHGFCAWTKVGARASSKPGTLCRTDLDISSRRSMWPRKNRKTIVDRTRNMLHCSSPCTPRKP